MRPAGALPPLTAAVVVAVLRGARTVREVAAEVGCALETAHRHLKAARELGLVGWESGRDGTMHTRTEVVR